MNREPLRFRAWDTVEKKMIYHLEDRCGLKADLACCNHIIMQFITMEGSQEIWEDDIIQETVHDKVVRRFVADNIRTFTREYDSRRLATFYDKEFKGFSEGSVLRDKPKKPLTILIEECTVPDNVVDAAIWEVIGDIHNNPELQELTP